MITLRAVTLTAVAVVSGNDPHPPGVILRFTYAGSQMWHRHYVEGPTFRKALEQFRFNTASGRASGLMRLGIRPSAEGALPTRHQLLQAESGRLLDLGDAQSGAARDLVSMLTDERIASAIERNLAHNASASFDNPHR